MHDCFSVNSHVIVSVVYQGHMADNDTVTTVDRKLGWNDLCDDIDIIFEQRTLYVKTTLNSTKGIVRLGVDKDLWFHNLSYSVVTSFNGAETHLLFFHELSLIV